MEEDALGSSVSSQESGRASSSSSSMHGHDNIHIYIHIYIYMCMYIYTHISCKKSLDVFNVASATLV